MNDISPAQSIEPISHAHPKGKTEMTESRYPERNRRQKEFPDFHLYFTESCDSNDPTSVQDALSRPDGGKWREAMSDELESLTNNEAWILVDKPADQPIVKCKWVFKKKYGSDGESMRYKARLVAKGFSQQPGIDFDETFAPVIRRENIRMLISLAAMNDWDILHLDVKTAFLNGKLDETIYMSQPEGSVQSGNENKVCLLQKAIYGLRQSSRAWNNTIHNFLLNLGLKQCKNEPCIYFKVTVECILIVALYVDDFLLFSNNPEETVKIKNSLMSEYEMQDLGEAKCCIGMRIRRDRQKGVVMLDQTKYIESLLKTFGMDDSKPVSTPIEPNIKLKPLPEGESSPEVPYQQLVGALLYLSVGTRPDIAHTVNRLSQFNTCFTQEHWNTLKRLLRYLKGTKDLCLVYGNTKQNLTGYVDADWGACEMDRHSYTGYVFTLGGAAVSWSSSKQRCVALSSTESEYIGLTEASKEALYLNSVLSEMFDVQRCPTIYNDNQSARNLAMNDVYHCRTKHIDIRYHFIREMVHSRKICLQYLPTGDMVADILTKGVPRVKHVKCINLLGLSHV
jgi:hypothetical protein